MTETKWLPDHYLDEVIPAARPMPTDSLWKDPETGKWHLAGFYCDGTRDEEWPLVELNDGDVVGFSPTEVYGEFDAVLKDDGRLSVRIPAKASHFGFENDETIFNSIEEIEAHIHQEGAANPGQTVGISAWWWGDSVPHRLVIEGGTARFEAVN
jgi:hypothetical protein